MQPYDYDEALMQLQQYQDTLNELASEWGVKEGGYMDAYTKQPITMNWVPSGLDDELRFVKREIITWGAMKRKHIVKLRRD